MVPCLCVGLPYRIHKNQMGPMHRTITTLVRLLYVFNSGKTYTPNIHLLDNLAFNTNISTLPFNHNSCNPESKASKCVENVEKLFDTVAMVEGLSTQIKWCHLRTVCIFPWGRRESLASVSVEDAPILFIHRDEDVRFDNEDLDGEEFSRVRLVRDIYSNYFKFFKNHRVNFDHVQSISLSTAMTIRKLGYMGYLTRKGFQFLQHRLIDKYRNRNDNPERHHQYDSHFNRRLEYNYLKGAYSPTFDVNVGSAQFPFGIHTSTMNNSEYTLRIPLKYQLYNESRHLLTPSTKDKFLPSFDILRRMYHGDFNAMNKLENGKFTVENFLNCMGNSQNTGLRSEANVIICVKKIDVDEDGIVFEDHEGIIERELYEYIYNWIKTSILNPASELRYCSVWLPNKKVVNLLQSVFNYYYFIYETMNRLPREIRTSLPQASALRLCALMLARCLGTNIRWGEHGQEVLRLVKYSYLPHRNSPVLPSSLFNMKATVTVGEEERPHINFLTLKGEEYVPVDRDEEKSDNDREEKKEIVYVNLIHGGARPGSGRRRNGNQARNLFRRHINPVPDEPEAYLELEEQVHEQENEEERGRMQEQAQAQEQEEKKQIDPVNVPVVPQRQQANGLQAEVADIEIEMRSLSLSSSNQVAARSEVPEVVERLNEPAVAFAIVPAPASITITSARGGRPRKPKRTEIQSLLEDAKNMF